MNRNKGRANILSAKRDILSDIAPEKIPMIWKCPSPETIDTECKTTYTFNYNPSYQPEMVGCKILLGSIKDFFKKVQESLDRCHHVLLDVYPEFSPSGRIHFHGFCKFREKAFILPFYLRDLKILNSNSQGEIDTILDHDQRYQYCTKQRHIMEDWCDSQDVPYLMTNYSESTGQMNFTKLKE